MPRVFFMNVRCNDARPCFAKGVSLDGEIVCGILSKTYPDNECPFCKKERFVTNGVRYPFDSNYGKPVKPGKEKEGFFEKKFEYDFDDFSDDLGVRPYKPDNC